jgi:hypothetical protein
MKLLLDENLSPSIAVILEGEGIDICHLRECCLGRGADAALHLHARTSEASANARTHTALASREGHASSTRQMDSSPPSSPRT